MYLHIIYANTYYMWMDEDISSSPDLFWLFSLVVMEKVDMADGHSTGLAQRKTRTSRNVCMLHRVK